MQSQIDGPALRLAVLDDALNSDEGGSLGLIEGCERQITFRQHLMQLRAERYVTARLRDGRVVKGAVESVGADWVQLKVGRRIVGMPIRTLISVERGS